MGCMSHFLRLILNYYRLSYFEDECILLVEKISNMHEAPLEHLHSIFCIFCLTSTTTAMISM
ncbi:hypothetical protein BDR07DRAFT_1612677 [Suillus spraguei]|nr:hypothetical protein BDR07DRAFT_1612677 [Suillus spraguei]